MIDELFKNGSRTILKEGDVLHSPNQKCRYIGLVNSGSLRISRILKSGKEIVLKQFKAGEVFADLIVFSEDYYPGWLIASEYTEVIEVRLSVLLDYLKNQDKMLKYFVELSNKVTSLTSNIEILSLKTIREKIAYCLLYNNSNENNFKISYIRNRVGCSREAFSRALNQMLKENLISKSNGKIAVINNKILENILK